MISPHVTKRVQSRDRCGMRAAFEDDMTRFTLNLQSQKPGANYGERDFVFAWRV